jgi:CBS domain-containing protein
MKTMGHFLADNNRQIYSVRPDATVLEALELMAQKNIGALLVLDGETLAGVFSERDYARKVILKGRTSNEALVKDVMTAEVITVQSTQNMEHCMQIMTDHHVRHLPIMEKQQVKGLISIGDVVKEMMAHQKATIEQLHSYIAS